MTGLFLLIVKSKLLLQIKKNFDLYDGSL